MKGNPNNRSSSTPPDPSNVRGRPYPPGPFIVTRQRLENLRPLFERRIAYFLLFLTYLGSFLGLLSSSPGESAQPWRWAVWVLIPLVATLLFQTLITAAQWIYGKNKRHWKYIVPTVVSVGLGFKGYLPVAVWFLNWATDKRFTHLPFWQLALAVSLPLGYLTLKLDIWPEQTLAER